MEGLCPTRGARGVPHNFSFVKITRFSRPTGGRYPSPLRLATPALRQDGVRHVCTCHLPIHGNSKGNRGRPDAQHHTNHTKPFHMAAFRQRADGRLPPRRGHRRPRGVGLLRRYSHRLLPYLRRASRECPHGTSQRRAGRHHHNPYNPSARLAPSEKPPAPCISRTHNPRRNHL